MWIVAVVLGVIALFVVLVVIIARSGMKDMAERADVVSARGLLVADPKALFPFRATGTSEGVALEVVTADRKALSGGRVATSTITRVRGTAQWPCGVTVVHGKCALPVSGGLREIATGDADFDAAAKTFVGGDEQHESWLDAEARALILGFGGGFLELNLAGGEVSLDVEGVVCDRANLDAMLDLVVAVCRAR